MYTRHCLKTSVYGVSWLVGLAMFTNEGEPHKKRNRCQRHFILLIHSKSQVVAANLLSSKLHISNPSS